MILESPSATTNQLNRDLRTVLARLDMCSTAPIAAYNPGGASNDPDPRPPGDPRAPSQHYQERIDGVNATLRNRLISALHGPPADRTHRITTAHHRATTAKQQILTDATTELERLTGRNGHPPTRHTARMDTTAGVKQAVQEDSTNRPADHIASQFGLSVFVVRRWYAEWNLDPTDGTEITIHTDDDSDLITRAQAMATRGMTQKRIALALGKTQPTISRYLRKTAA